MPPRAFCLTPDFRIPFNAAIISKQSGAIHHGRRAHLAAIGSFLNVCIYRLPRDKAPWRPQRSYCPHCHETIAWYDNIPLVSWFLLGAQCRHCGSYISPRYILVEFLTAILFAVSFWVLFSRAEPKRGIW